jgi:hypothetical protein
MLKAGIPAKMIARFARISGYETAHRIMYALSDSTSFYEGFPPEENEVGFSLRAWEVETEEDLDSRSLVALHESILSADPSGREMRPE